MTSFKTKVAGSVKTGSSSRSSFNVKSRTTDPGWSITYSKLNPVQSITIKPVTLKLASKGKSPSPETITNRVQIFSGTLSKKPSPPKVQLAKNVQTKSISSNRSSSGIGAGVLNTPQGSFKALVAKSSSFKAKKS